MRRHWRNKAASTAAAIMIAASMFSGSLTTAWAEGEVAETTSEEMPTYEASDDSATEEEPVVDEEEDDEESFEADEDGSEDYADGGEADGETADGEETDGEETEGEETDGEVLDEESSDETPDAAEGEAVEGDEENADDETVDETEDANAATPRTPDITDGTSYSSDTTISGKTIQGVVTVEDDTRVVFEDCTFIGAEDDGQGDMGVAVEGDGVAVLKNATFIIMEEEIDDDGLTTVGEEYELIISNVFDGGKVGENTTTTVEYPCEAGDLTVNNVDYEELLAVEAGDLSIDQDYDTVLTYRISYTPDKSGYNATHETTMEFDINKVMFPTVLNVEAGGPPAEEPEEPEGPATDSGDGITPKRTITVEKKWKNAEKYYDHSKLHVLVKILDSDNNVIGEVDLNKDNRWTATFPAADSDLTLDMDAEYTVEEYKILNGNGEDVTKGYKLVDRQEKNRYSYSRTDEVKVGGTYILGYSLDGNASYQLMSSDGSRIVTTKVPARTWTDVEPSDTFYWNALAPSQKDYHNNDSFWNFQHKSTGGYVHGSEDDFSMSSSSTPIKYYARQFRYKYGENANEYSMYSHDADDNCTKIAMDGAQIYPIVYSKDTLFTLTNQECFYVYHSSDCVTETYMLRDDLTDKDAGTFDIVRLVRDKHLYGGYYRSYADEGVRYTGASSKWNFSEAYTESGFKMIPEPGKTYYLKEVPNEYLRIKTYTIAYDSDNKIYQGYFITVVDDSNYLTVGFDGKNLKGDSLEGKDERGDDNPATDLYRSAVFKKTTFTPKDYAKVTAGLIDIYSWYYDMNPNPTLKGNSSVEGTPYLITPDNVKVWQITRKTTINAAGTGRSNKDSSIVAKMLANALPNPSRILKEVNLYNSNAAPSNSNSSQSGSGGSSSSGSGGSSSSGGGSSSSGGGSSSSGGGSSSSGGGSSSSGGGSSTSGSGTQGTAANDTGNTGATTGDANATGDTNANKADQSRTEPAVTGNNADENDQNGDPDASLNQDKQSGNAQNNGGTWSQKKNHGSRWWIYLLGIGACAGAWFLIWKRREDEDSNS